MINKKLATLFFGVVCFLYASTSSAQSDTIVKPVKKLMLCEVKMHDGSSYKGFLEKQTDSLVYLKSGSGVLIHIPKNQITNIDFIKGHTTTDSTGNVLIHLPPIADNYYVVTSNAFLLKKGEVYGSSSYGLFWNVNYAFSKNFSGGLSTSIIGAPIGLHLKGNFEIGHKLYLGVEGVAGSLVYLGPNSYGEAGTIKLTYGDEKKNYSFFAGYVDATYYVMPRQRRGRRGGGRGPSYYERFTSPEIGAAISLPISNKMNFTSEIFAFPSISIYTASLGIRTNVNQKISWIFAIQALGNADAAISKIYPIPYLGFSFRL